MKGMASPFNVLTLLSWRSLASSGSEPATTDVGFEGYLLIGYFCVAASYRQQLPAAGFAAESGCPGRVVEPQGQSCHSLARVRLESGERVRQILEPVTSDRVVLAKPLITRDHASATRHAPCRPCEMVHLDIDVSASYANLC